MVIPKIRQLAATREKLARLEITVETELRQELSALHAQYGFADVKSFLKAVQEAAGFGPKKARKAGRPKKAAPAPKTRKRAVITAGTRARVKQLVKAGKSGSQIAKAVGISLPSVQNIKKALGLVKSRGLKAEKAPAAKKPARKVPARKAPAKKAPAKKAPAKKTPPKKAAPPVAAPEPPAAPPAPAQ